MRFSKGLIMKLKLAIVYGILAWFLTYIISTILNPFIIDNIPYINIVIPISIIIVTGFFGILYIRNFNSHEVFEGFVVGMIFFVIDFVCDLVFFILPNNHNVIVDSYPLHLISMIIMIPLITTFIGYLAQMTINPR